METARANFENLVYQGMKSQGLDDLSSKLIAILYSDPDPVTLKELSEKTNYSFSAVSAAMKTLADWHIVERKKKGGSKKLYFSIQRDMIAMTLDQVKSKKQLMVAPALRELPRLIKKYEQSKAEESEETLRIIKQYYQQMVALELILDNAVEFTEKLQKEMNKE